MSLTDDERHELELIEQELRRQDPVLADQLDAAPTQDRRRLRMTLACHAMVVGALMMVLGMAAAQGIPSLGAIFCLYGMVVVVLAVTVAVRNRIRRWPAGPGAWPPAD